MLSLILVSASCVTGCGRSKADEMKSAEQAFMLEAEKLAWYGPAREALYLHILKWHREKGIPCSSAHDLSRFVKVPLRFTVVGEGGHTVQKQLDWNDIKVKPVGFDGKDKRFYTYEIQLAGIQGRTGVEGLNAPRPRSPLP